MSKIEWERQPDGIIAGHADFVRYQAYEGEQETWQRIHDARVTEIAAANGYIKLEPGQVVVQVEDLTRIITWFYGDARTVPLADMDETLYRFKAAIDAASKEGE